MSYCPKCGEPSPVRLTPQLSQIQCLKCGAVYVVRVILKTLEDLDVGSIHVQP